MKNQESYYSLYSFSVLIKFHNKYIHRQISLFSFTENAKDKMNDIYDAFGDDCNQTLADMPTTGTSSNSFMSYEHKSIVELLTIPEVRDNISEFFKNNSINISICNLTKLVLNYSKEQQQQLERNTLSANNNDENNSSDIILYSIITIFYAIIFIAGILGNLITCIVISRNKFMHTATNFYLFNLAVSDLILLLSGEFFFI